MIAGFVIGALVGFAVAQAIYWVSDEWVGDEK